MLSATMQFSYELFNTRFYEAPIPGCGNRRVFSSGMQYNFSMHLHRHAFAMKVHARGCYRLVIRSTRLTGTLDRFTTNFLRKSANLLTRTAVKLTNASSYYFVIAIAAKLRSSYTDVFQLPSDPPNLSLHHYPFVVRYFG